MKAFITGSRVYGTPREDSDVDLVVYVSPEDAEILRAQSEVGTEDIENDAEQKERYASAPGASLRFGKLNLLVLTFIDDVHGWKTGTDQLKAKRPVTRDVAVKTFAGIRKAAKEIK